MAEKFNCYQEREEKGIFMEVDTESYENLVGFTFFSNSEVDGEVCLEKEAIEKLIVILQNVLNK